MKKEDAKKESMARLINKGATMKKDITYGVMAILTAGALACCLWFDLNDRLDKLRSMPVIAVVSK